MRKIERQMCDAIANGKDWKSGNTQVITINDVAWVYLHGNHIATVTDTDVTVYDGGWRSVTSKSRLNSLINNLCDGRMFGVFQRKHQWYINDGVVTVDFEHGYKFPRI
jgi:hypothetical protein